MFEKSLSSILVWASPKGSIYALIFVKGTLIWLKYRKCDIFNSFQVKRY